MGAELPLKKNLPNDTQILPSKCLDTNPNVLIIYRHPDYQCPKNIIQKMCAK